MSSNRLAFESGLVFAQPGSVTLRYEHPMVLCIPDAWASAHSYALWQRELSRHSFSSIAMSFEHHQRKTLQSYLEDVERQTTAIVNRTKQPITLMGHGVGAALAYWVASRHPIMVESVVMVNVVPFGVAEISKAMSKASAFWFRHLPEILSGICFKPSDRELGKYFFSQAGRGWKKQINHHPSRFSGRALAHLARGLTMAECKKPVLAVIGRQDRFMPEADQLTFVQRMVPLSQHSLNKKIQVQGDHMSLLYDEEDYLVIKPIIGWLRNSSGRYNDFFRSAAAR